jgi:hypothetical protein
LALAGAGLGVCLLARAAAAEPPAAVIEAGPANPPASAASSECAHRRAGYPQAIRRCAVPSDTGHYIGYYVGGGCPCYHTADPPYPEDGTWGWDYRGWLIPRRIILGWWHGRRYQGGIGAYATDGPHLPHLEEQDRGH